MTNKDLHSLYSIFDLCNEITFLTPAEARGLEIAIGTTNHETNREDRHSIADKLFSLDLRAPSFFIGKYEALNIFRCKDDYALKFRLILPVPGDDSLEVNDSITIDSNIPENDDCDIFIKLMVSMKAKMAANVMKALFDENLEKNEGGCYAR